MAVRWKDKTPIGTPASGDRIPITDVDDTNTDKYLTPADIHQFIEENALTMEAGIDMQANEMTGTNFDINGGTIDGVSLGTSHNAITEAQIDNININGNTISSTDANGDINLTPNGTGSVVADDIKINGANIGISADIDLLEITSGVLEINGDIEFGKGADRTINVKQANSATNGYKIALSGGEGGTGNTNGGDVTIDGGLLDGTGANGNVELCLNRGVVKSGVICFSDTAQNITSAAAITNATARTRLSGALAPYTVTINDGLYEGQRKSVIMPIGGGNVTLSANISGTSIVWNTAGETAILEWDVVTGLWYWMGGSSTYTA
jgi:hypothetical protein